MKIFFRYLLIGLAPMLLLSSALSAAGEEQAAGHAARQSADVAALLDSLGRNVSRFQTLKTDFTQEKRLAVFQNTVLLRGRIFLQKPARIAWHVDAPLKYSVVISDASIRQWDEDTDRVQEITFAKNPVLQNVMQQLTVWFSGDYSSLLKDYEVLVAGERPVILRFTPKKTSMAAKVVKQVQIEFREDNKYLRKLTITEQGGDSTSITFTGTVFDVPLDARDFEVKRRV